MRKGIKLKKDKIERNLLEKSAQEWYAKQRSVTEMQLFKNRSER